MAQVTRQRTILIVGGGVAAYRCAFELRARGFDGVIRLVSREVTPPYDRTLLSKEFLNGSVEEVDLLLDLEQGYIDAEIELELGVSAIKLDAAAKRVILSSEREVRYDQVVICSGGKPRVPRALSGVGELVLRELRDAELLRSALDGCHRLIIVGAGFIGAEVAAAATDQGVEVTMIEALAAPLAHTLGPQVAARIAALHEASGVDLVVSAPVERIRKARNNLDITLADGREAHGDAVLVATGMETDTGWLTDSDVHIDDGVVTDSRCRTSIPGVFAAGDCARWWNPRYGTFMRVEHWDTAARHGAAAAASVLGAREQFAPVPFVWSHQHGVRLQWIGYAPVWDEVHVDDFDPPRQFIARYLYRGKLRAAFAANNPRAIALIRQELETQDWGKDEQSKG